MSEEKVIDPLLANEDCDACSDPETKEPTECVAPVESIRTPNRIERECNDCPDEIVPPPITIPDIEVTKKCYKLDPAYDKYFAWYRHGDTGKTVMIIQVNPACGAIRNDCNHCKTSCEEDPYYAIPMQFSRGDEVYQWMAESAEKPLFFMVDRSIAHDDDMNKKIGFVIVGADNLPNYWYRGLPSDWGWIQTSDHPFKGSFGHINTGDVGIVANGNTLGTLPMIVEETPVTSSVTNNPPSSSSAVPPSNAASTQVSTIAEQVNNVNDSVDFDLSQYFTNNNSLTYQVSGLPTGLSIDNAIGKVTGNVTTPGSYLVEVMADDGQNNTSTTSFNWVVN